MFLSNALGYLRRRLWVSNPRMVNLRIHQAACAVSSSDKAGSVVSVIIPTRDKVDLLRNCLDSLMREITAARLEIIVVDNDSKMPETKSYLNGLPAMGISVIEYPGAFNYSALTNFAIDRSTGNFICLVNNDVEGLSGGWIDRMLTHAQDPKIGVVGALLTYPSGLIQHLGVSLGLSGAAGHVFKRLSLGHESVRHLIGICFEVSAVTFACAMFSRETFVKLDGLNEKFAIGLNDIDFCLRASEAGLINVIDTSAHLMHHESKSRKRMTNPAGAWTATIEVIRFLKKHDKSIRGEQYFTRQG